MSNRILKKFALLGVLIATTSKAHINGPNDAPDRPRTETADCVFFGKPCENFWQRLFGHDKTSDEKKSKKLPQESKSERGPRQTM